MRKKLLPGLVLLAGLFFTLSNTAETQVLQVSSAITPDEMVQMLIGVGVDYSK